MEHALFLFSGKDELVQGLALHSGMMTIKKGNIKTTTKCYTSTKIYVEKNLDRKPDQNLTRAPHAGRLVDAFARPAFFQLWLLTP